MLVLAPGERQSGEFVLKAKEFVSRLGIRDRRDGNNTVSIDSIGFRIGSRIVGLPGNEAKVRGFTAPMILIDEAARVPDELYRAMPCKATGHFTKHIGRLSQTQGAVAHRQRIQQPLPETEKAC